MELYQLVLAVATLATGMAAGIFFTFTAVIIPGLKNVSDRDALKGFQAIDRRLQPNSPSTDWQPLFGGFIFGASFLLMAASVLGFSKISDEGKILVLAATAIYTLGFCIPTFTTILPFNNSVRDVNFDTIDERELKKFRTNFERSWSGWHLVRTASSVLAFVLLIAFWLL